jgi:hypothetical protein
VRVERLGDEIVGAGFESLDAILGLLKRGDEHDRNQPRPRVGLQRPADVEAVGRRHHHVEQDQVGGSLRTRSRAAPFATASTR